MFKRYDVCLKSNPTCREPIYEIRPDDFKFYDKDGFELNKAEQEYYRMMKHPIDHPILNHSCWQEPWFKLEEGNPDLILDHSMILHRYNYTEHAAYQLNKIKSDIPEAQWLLNTPQKWGFDFALDAVSEDGSVFEVLHVEYDSYDFDEFRDRMISFDYSVRHEDWKNAAKRVWNHRDEWKDLKSFAQNDWKAKFLVGWKKAEFTEKSLTL